MFSNLIAADPSFCDLLRQPLCSAIKTFMIKTGNTNTSRNRATLSFALLLLSGGRRVRLQERPAIA
jgi:hypothetical protein